MKQIWITVALVALGLLGLQTFWIYSSKDDQMEATVVAARIDVCAQIAGAAADFREKAAIGRNEAQRGALQAETFEILRDAPRETVRAISVGRYLLPKDPFEQLLAEMEDATTKTPSAVFAGDAERIRRLIDDFDGAAQRVQDGCRDMVSRSRFAL